MKKFILAIFATLTVAIGPSLAQMMGGMMQPYGYYPPMGMMPMMGMRPMMPPMMMGMPMHMMMPMMGMGPMMPPMMMMQNPVFIERMLYMITMHPEAFKEALKRNPELKKKLQELIK